MGLDVKVEGVKELKQLFDQLPSYIQKNVLSGANRAGAQVIRKEAIAQLNGKGISGAAAKVVVRKSKYSTEEAPSVLVGNHKDAYELGILERGAPAHIIETLKATGERQQAEVAAGTRKKATKRTGTGSAVLADASKNTFFGATVKHPGFIALPWLRPAIDSKKADALKTVAMRLKKGIEREALKLAGKYKPRGKK